MAAMLSVRARMGGMVAMLAAGAVTSMGQDISAGAGAAGMSATHVADVRVSPLDRPLTMRMRGVPLREALMFVESAAEIRLRVYWAAAGTEGLDPELPVDLNARGMLPDKAIETLLRQANAAREQDLATWQMAADGEVEIGPRSRLNAHKTTVVYEVRDLAMPVPNFSDVPAIDLTAALQSAQSTPFRDSAATDKTSFEKPDPTPHEQLMTLIMDTVEPEQWADRGGSGATMKLWQGRIVVTAPGYVHRQIK